MKVVIKHHKELMNHQRKEMKIKMKILLKEQIKVKMMKSKIPMIIHCTDSKSR